MGTLQPTEHDQRMERRVRDLESCVERLSERISALEESVRTDPVPRLVSIDTPRADTLSAQLLSSYPGASPPDPLHAPSHDLSAPSSSDKSSSGRVASLATGSLGETLHASPPDPLHALSRHPSPDDPATDVASFASSGSSADLDAGWIALVGRTCLVLAGAFLLRALTDTGRLPTTTGVWIGLAYASVWLGLAAVRGRRGGLVHGVTSLVIALPLVAEAATRFHVLGAAGSAITLAVVAMGALLVAWKRRLILLSLAAIFGLAGTALVTAISLGAFLAPTLAVVIAGIAACGVGTDRRWVVLAWFAAFSADMAALLLAVRASAAIPLDSAPGSLLTLALVGAGFVCLFLWQTRRPPAEAGVFEATQTVAALAIAIGAAIPIARAAGIDTHVISVPALLSGVALFVYAFAVVSRKGGRAQFYYVGMTAFGLSLAGTALSVGPPIRTILLAAAAIGATSLAVRQTQPMLALQGTVTAVAAAISGGLVSLVSEVWLTGPRVWPEADVNVWIVLVATLIVVLVPRSLRHEQPSPTATVARLALALTLAAGSSTVVVLALGPWLAGASPDAGVTATIKSVTLAAATFVTAFASRAPRFRELSWLTYALMAAGGLKIAVEDFPRSSPSTLFVALAAFGLVLIAVPKILRKT